MVIKVGQYVIDKYDKKKKKVMGISGELLFIGRDREPVRAHEVEVIEVKPKKSTTMATKRKATKKRTSSVGVKANGTLKKGFRYAKGGRVVAAKKSK